jgi:hypothetical protein
MYAKIFAGFQVKPDLKEKLDKSVVWKQSRIVMGDGDLVEVSKNGKNYLGLYMDEEAPSFKSLQQTEYRVKMMLQHYLPGTPTHDLQIEIFSKVFV